MLCTWLCRLRRKSLSGLKGSKQGCSPCSWQSMWRAAGHSLWSFQRGQALLSLHVLPTAVLLRSAILPMYGSHVEHVQVFKVPCLSRPWSCMHKNHCRSCGSVISGGCNDMQKDGLSSPESSLVLNDYAAAETTNYEQRHAIGVELHHVI